MVKHSSGAMPPRLDEPSSAFAGGLPVCCRTGDGTRRPPAYSSSKKDMCGDIGAGGTMGRTSCGERVLLAGGSEEDSFDVLLAGGSEEDLFDDVTDEIMNPCASMVGEAVWPAPPPRHWACPRMKVDPPGGWCGLVAFRISAVKLCGWLAITLHCAEVCDPCVPWA